MEYTPRLFQFSKIEQNSELLCDLEGPTLGEYATLKEPLPADAI